MAMNEGSQPAPTRAMRLIFEYEGNQVRLVSQQPVEMAITGSDLARVEHPGYYVDTRDGGGRTTRLSMEEPPRLVHDRHG
jgi:hypothetical protein